jgi:hypothetical protein
MTRFLGIDHPLIAFRDLPQAVERYSALGFQLTPVGKHPWGTSTVLAMFDRCALELMGVYDESLIDEKPIGDFRFGRTVRDQLAERDGITLLALYSNNAEGDAAAVQARGVTCQGSVEFGRDVVLPDGRKDRTKTTLKILQSSDLPRLSNFACQQHRPELIYVPSWLEHPNKAFGISRVTILAERSDHGRVRQRLAGLYHEDALFESADGFGARTGNGDFIVLDRKAASERYGDIPAAFSTSEPCYVGIDVRVPDVATVMPFIEVANMKHRKDEGSVLLTDAGYFGNVFLSFVSSKRMNG